MTLAFLEEPCHEPVVERATSTPREIRVLHLINGEHYSGAERVQDLLALRLTEHGYSAGFACVKPGLFSRMRQAQAAPLHEVPMRGRLDLAAVMKIARLVRSEGYVLIHAHTPRTALLGRLAAIAAGVPLVYHVHSPTSRDSTRRWQNRFNALAERLAIAGRVQLVAVSESLGAHMRRQGIAEKRLTVVPNGVPGCGPLPPRATPRQQWILGTVALFRPRKGIEVLLEALAELHRAGLPVRLRAVGGFETPDYEAGVRSQVAALGVSKLIDWTGFTRDVPRELAQMDLLVLPSLFGEGLPMVVLEAMAAGVPVVATHVEGVPEAIRNGIDGVLAKPSDAADLARAIGQIVRGELDWQALRTAAHARHAERFSDHSMAAGLAAVYNRVLGKQHAG